MQVEQLEVLDFLRGLAPFADVPEDLLTRAAASADVRYHRAGTTILEFGAPAQHWFVLRSGAVEIFRRDGSLYNRLTAGGHFGEFGLLRHKRVRFPAKALEDCVLYLLPDALFSELFETCAPFADAVEIEDHSRLRSAAAPQGEANERLAVAVETLISHPPLMVDRLASAREAAQRMTEAGVTSLLVTEAGDDEAPVKVAGILTDADLRSKLVAPGLAFDAPVHELMSSALVTLPHDRPVSEALQQMLRHNLRHLPVFKDRQPIGLLTLSDILRLESQHSVFVVGSIFRASSVDELAALQADVRASFLRMAQAETASRQVGGAMAAIGRSFKQRLLELAEAELGPPPVPYCFVALGSMARQEQLIVTDQDNALVLDDRFVPAKHDAYFETLARRVSDGLARSGYPYCTGGVMATNPSWRQPLSVWTQTFRRWIDEPTPEDLLNSSIFFDIDGVWGRTEWTDRLRRDIARHAAASPRFLACMARNALLRTPPLGFFKGFVMESDGRHANTINLKRRGTAPLVDLIRVHALAVGSRARSSFDRLKDVNDAGILPSGRGQDLHDALDFISSVRIHHLAEDMVAGDEPVNSIEPDKLSEFDRKRLRDAFMVLDGAQQFLKFRYQPGRPA